MLQLEINIVSAIHMDFQIILKMIERILFTTVGFSWCRYPLNQKYCISMRGYIQSCNKGSQEIVEVSTTTDLF